MFTMAAGFATSAVPPELGKEFLVNFDLKCAFLLQSGYLCREALDKEHPLPKTDSVSSEHSPMYGLRLTRHVGLVGRLREHPDHRKDELSARVGALNVIGVQHRNALG